MLLRIPMILNDFLGFFHQNSGSFFLLFPPENIISNYAKNYVVLVLLTLPYRLTTAASWTLSIKIPAFDSLLSLLLRRSAAFFKKGWLRTQRPGFESYNNNFSPRWIHHRKKNLRKMQKPAGEKYFKSHFRKV